MALEPLAQVLAQLGIPDELIGVHRLVIVSATALLLNVSREREPEGECDVHASAIVEGPAVDVGIGLQLVAGVLIRESAVQSDVEGAIGQEVVAIVQTQIVADVGALGCGFLQGHLAEHLVEVNLQGIVVAIDVAPGTAVAVAALVTDMV